MGRWLQNLSYRIQVFMQGRYGYDPLSTFLAFAGLFLMLLSWAPPLRWLSFAAMALYAWVLFRALSRNIPARQRERDAFLRLFGGVRGKAEVLRSRWRDRDTHRYYTCPHCKATVRIPKPGKGRKISITCPKCGGSFVKKT